MNYFAIVHIKSTESEKIPKKHEVFSQERLEKLLFPLSIQHIQISHWIKKISLEQVRNPRYCDKFRPLATL